MTTTKKPTPPLSEARNGFPCPSCKERLYRCLSTRSDDDGTVRRRYGCPCGHKFKSVERYEIEPEGWLPVAEYAERTGETVNVVYYRVKVGKLESKKVNGKTMVRVGEVPKEP
jgi:predicted RNA-binding Zn-ribbon protein involved in translation (DUF1610 family)